MMNTFAKSVAATALTGSAIALGSGMANAAPPAKPHAPVNPDRVSAGLAPGVTYTGDSKSGAAEIKTPWGKVSMSQGRYAVSDAAGRAVYGDPKTTGLKPSKQSSVTAASSANLFRPGMGAVAGAPAPKPLTEKEKNDAKEAAVAKVGTNFGLAYGVGAMVGGVAGVVVGCPVGAVTAGLTSAAVSAGGLTPAGAILGCLVGGATFGGIAAIAGGAVVATPVAIVSAGQQIQYLQSIGAL